MKSWRHSRTELGWNLRCIPLLRLQTREEHESSESITYFKKLHISCSLHRIIQTNVRVLVVSHLWMKAVSKRSALRHRWRIVQAEAKRSQTLVLVVSLFFFKLFYFPRRTFPATYFKHSRKDSPLISLVNLTLWESVRGRGCSSMLWMSRTSHMNWMTGCAL